MNEDEFKIAWSMITSAAQIAQFVSVEDVEALINTANSADSIMPIVDPTAWIKGKDNLVDQRDIARGFLAFRRAIEKVKDRHNG